MKKIKLTEAQTLMLEKHKNQKELLESVEKTKGGQAVRNLIAEGDTIKGELQSLYGKWNLAEWDSSGVPLKSKNKFDEISNTIKLKDSE